MVLSSTKCEPFFVFTIECQKASCWLHRLGIVEDHEIQAYSSNRVWRWATDLLRWAQYARHTMVRLLLLFLLRYKTRNMPCRGKKIAANLIKTRTTANGLFTEDLRELQILPRTVWIKDDRILISFDQFMGGAAQSVHNNKLIRKTKWRFVSSYHSMWWDDAACSSSPFSCPLLYTIQRENKKYKTSKKQKYRSWEESQSFNYATSPLTRLSGKTTTSFDGSSLWPRGPSFKKIPTFSMAALLEDFGIGISNFRAATTQRRKTKSSERSHNLNFVRT